MCRCRACDAELVGVNRAYRRVIILEDGTKKKIDEDLCRDCREAIFRCSDPDEFDLIDALGWDVDNG